MLKTFDNFVILPQLVTTVFISVGGKQEIGAVKGQFAVIEMDQEEGSQARLAQSVEHETLKYTANFQDASLRHLRVVGSSPTSGVVNFPGLCCDLQLRQC